MTLYDHFTEKDLEILKVRAARVASVDQTDLADDTILDGLILNVGGERYAMPLGDLTKVYGDTPIVAVPCTPTFVAGVANVRGHVVPVIDLSILLGMSGNTTTNIASLVVVESEDMTVAFRVEAIGDAVAIHTAELAPVPATLELQKPEYLEGTLPDGTILLDIDAILRDPALIVEDIVG